MNKSMSTTATQTQEVCLPAIGIDAGKVNMGIGCIRFYGVKQLLAADDDDDDEEGGGAATGKTIPHFDIMAGERWDVTRGIIHRAGADWKSMEPFVANPPSVKSEALKDMANHITHMVAKSPWLFETTASLLDNGATHVLPVLVIENQSDFVDRAAGKDAQGKQRYDYKKAVMGPLAESVATAIRTVDAVKCHSATPDSSAPAKRERLGAMSKYGLRCDASRDRPERKEEAVDAFLELLSELGTENALRWFHWFTAMEAAGEQIHDIVDALSLAVQSCFMRYQKHGKQELRKLELKQREEIKKRRELLNSIRQVPTRPKKAAANAKTPRKKKEPAKKKAKASSSVEMPSGEDIEEMATKPIKKKAAATKGKTKRKRSSAASDDDVVIMSVDPIKKKTKVAEDDDDVHSKYPMLLLDEPLQHSQ
jgi:hypothetical protein